MIELYCQSHCRRCTRSKHCKSWRVLPLRVSHAEWSRKPFIRTVVSRSLLINFSLKIFVLTIRPEWNMFLIMCEPPWGLFIWQLQLCWERPERGHSRVTTTSPLSTVAPLWDSGTLILNSSQILELLSDVKLMIVSQLRPNRVIHETGIQTSKLNF